MEYLLAAKQRCDVLVVGITNPDDESLIPESTDPKRSDLHANPFTYFERMRHVGVALRSAGLREREYMLTPGFVTQPERMLSYLPAPEETTCFATIYDEWGDAKAERMHALGFEVEVLWRRSMTTRVASGSQIRELMRAGERWEHLVPAGVAAAIGPTGQQLQ